MLVFLQIFENETELDQKVMVLAVIEKDLEMTVFIKGQLSYGPRKCLRINVKAISLSGAKKIKLLCGASESGVETKVC